MKYHILSSAFVVVLMLLLYALVASAQTNDESPDTQIIEEKMVKVDTAKSNKLNFFKRLLGKCITQPPSDPGCWKFEEGKVVIELQRAPELSQENGALRLENDKLPVKLLVIRGDDGAYYAFQNKCTHGGRRLDPVPGGGTVQCCSVGKSTFDYEGKVLAGSAKEGIKVLPLVLEDGKLIVSVD